MNDLQITLPEITKPLQTPRLSLKELTGRKEIELVQLIAHLMPAAPESIKNLQDIKQLFHQDLSYSEQELQNIRHLVHNLIFRQFPRPETDAIRELISNSLDAHVRAKTESEPIFIQLQGNKLTVQDHGDGIGFDTLVNFFVPGRSSNPSAIFSLERGIPNVTGRFGQGGVSLFYFLLYHTLKSSPTLPEFSANNHQIRLPIAYDVDGKSYEVVFTCSLNEKNVQIHCKDISSKIEKKITVNTYREGQRLKLKFFEEGGLVKLDLYQYLTPSSKIGSCFKIISPLIESHKDAIERSIRSNFEHVSNTILKLNGKKLNLFEMPPQSFEYCQNIPHACLTTTDPIPLVNSTHEPIQTSISSHNELVFEWGSLSFTPPSQARSGSITLCEGGKLILEWPIITGLVPDKTVIDFNILNLTHDRASISFTDTRLKQAILQAIHRILSSSQIANREKSSLLNALFPLLKEDAFHLLEELWLEIKKSPYSLLPDLPELAAMDRKNTLLLNPRYLKTIQEPILYQSGTQVFHLIDVIMSTPAVYCDIGDHTHYFIDSRLYSSDTPIESRYNLSLLNSWLENEGMPGQILLNVFSGISPVALNHKAPQIPLENKLEPAPLSFIEQQDKTDASECLKSSQRELFLKQLSEDPAYAEPVMQEVISFMKDVKCSLGITKRSIRYLYHRLCQSPELLPLIKQVKKIELGYALRYEYSLENLEAFFEYYKYFLKAHSDEIDRFNLFASKGLFESMSWRFGFSETPYPHSYYHEAYFRWRQLIDISGTDNKDIIEKTLSYGACLKLTDDHLQLIANVSLEGERQALTGFVHQLKDTSFLIHLPQHQRDEVATVLINIKYFYSGDFNRILYEKIIDLVDRFKGPLQDKFIWIESSIAFAYLIPKYSLVPIKEHNFLDNAIAYYNARHSSNYSPDTVQDLGNSIVKVHNLNDKIKSLLSNMRGLKGVKAGNFTVTKNHLPTLVEKMSKPCKSWLTDTYDKPIKEYIELALEWKEHVDSYEKNPTAAGKIALTQKYIELLERNGCIMPRARTFFYSAFASDEDEFISRNYRLPTIETPSVLLQHDTDVVGYLKNSQLAASRIQSAIQQTHLPYSWIVELVKNCREAGANKIAVEVHLDSQEALAICITDNGKGMGPEELKALKIPGYTSKRKGEDDPNFGWGFFTLFNEFDSVYVSTSEDCVHQHELLFEKNDAGLALKQKTSIQNSPAGTRLVLKRKVNNPNQELLMLKAHFTNTCIQLKDVSVSFQNYPITIPTSTNSEFTHTETYFEKGVDKGPIQFEITSSKEGLYWKDLRLGSLSEPYFDLLPIWVKIKLEKNKQRFCISLPDVKHNMNRNHLLNKSDLLETIQRGILCLSIQYYLNTCVKEGDIEVLSKDFWNNFRTSYDSPSSFSQQLVRALTQHQWDLAAPQKHQLERQQIYDAFKAYFSEESTKGSVKISYDGKPVNPQEALSQIQSHVSQQCLQALNSHLKGYLCDPRQFAEIVMHLPLKQGAFSLNSLRSSLKQILFDHGIISEGGTLRTDFANLSFDDAYQKLAKSINYLSSKMQLKPMYVPLLEHFLNSILNKFHGMNSQKKMHNLVATSSLDRIASYLKSIARDILHHEISIVYYDKVDSADAYTYKGSNTLYLNKRNPSVIFLSSWLDSIAQDATTMLPFEAESLDKLTRLLVILCHEITHQKENRDCSSTHDETFKKLMNKLIQLLFIRSSSQKQLLRL